MSEAQSVIDRINTLIFQIGTNAPEVPVLQAARAALLLAERRWRFPDDENPPESGPIEFLTPHDWVMIDLTHQHE